MILYKLIIFQKEFTSFKYFVTLSNLIRILIIILDQKRQVYNDSDEQFTKKGANLVYYMCATP